MKPLYTLACAALFATLGLAQGPAPTSLPKHAILKIGDNRFHGAAIVCVVTLDAPEAPPYLRNLLRRIRERAPRAQLIVGIGGQSERVDEVGALSDTQNANAFSDLVNQCVQAANAVSAPLVEKAPRSVGA